MATLKFVKSSKGSGTRVNGILQWGNDTYKVVSGGYGKGQIPNGKYTVERFKAVTGNKDSMKSGFVNPNNGRGWFLPLTQLFSTSRHGFGVHPDGNVVGTKGCIGLQGNDIAKFWDKWLKTTLKSRPNSLEVSSNIKPEKTVTK